MIRVAICDDEAKQIEILVGYINDLSAIYPNLEYDVYRSGRELVEHYQNVNMEEFYDIIFLDIEIGDSHGYEVAKIIKEIDELLLIVYVTQHGNLIQQSFEAEAFDFIVKPAEQKRFDTVFHRAYRKIRARGNAFCFYHYYNHVRVLTDKIMYFEFYRGRAKVFTTDTVYEFNRTVKDTLVGLDHDHFLLVHRSYIVNMRYIEELSYQQLRLMDGTVLPVSEKRSAESKVAFERYTLRRIVR